MPIRVIPATLFAMLALGASAAWATPVTRYASATSVVTSGACDQSAPCTLVHDLGVSASGDTVLVEPGTYELVTTAGDNSDTTVPGGVTVMGDPTQPRPVIEQHMPYATCSCPLLAVNDGATLRHLEIEQLGVAGAAAINLGASVVVDDSILLGSDAAAYTIGDGMPTVSLIRDSLLVGGTYGVDMRISGSKLTLEGDTVIATAPGSAAALLDATTATGTQLVAGNSILQGVAYDVQVTATSTNIAAFFGNYSSFRRVAGDVSGSGAGIHDTNHDVTTTAPRFVNAAAGDYHELQSSPTVDAGAAGLVTGTTDLDGNPRIGGAAPDMGAYEWTPIVPLPIIGPAPVVTVPLPTPPVPKPAPKRDTKPPTLGHAKVHLADGALKIAITLSEHATVTVQLAQAKNVLGKVVRTLFTGKRTVTIRPSVVHQLAAGTATITLSARDTAGNLSRPQTVHLSTRRSGRFHTLHVSAR
jgi:hypothetical protein